MKKSKTKLTIKHTDIKTRDHLLVKLLKGATKGGAHTDRKKQANKKEARQTVEVDEDVESCRQCGFPIRDGITTSKPDGFCSDSCMDFYNEQLGE